MYVCMYIYIYIYNPLAAFEKRSAAAAVARYPLPIIGWRYMSNVTLCNTASSALCAFRSVKAPHTLLHYSPLLKKTCVRQVVSDKWLPPSIPYPILVPATLSRRSSSRSACREHTSAARRSRAPRSRPRPRRRSPVGGSEDVRGAKARA